MQIDQAMLDKYKKEAPELLDAVEASEESPWIMRKDKKTGYCVKFDNGWCGIHKEKGAEFLGDACFFYPRVTRVLGDKVIMTAALSCPEITRLVLEDIQPFVFESDNVERLPYTLKNYLPEGLTPDNAIAVHKAFLDACEDGTVSAEHVLARIASVSRSIQMLDKKTWAESVPFYLKHADTRLPEPVGETTDAFNLLHALSGLIVASRKPMSDRLRETVKCMEAALAVKLDWQNVQITTTARSIEAYHACVAAWRKSAKQYDTILKRWLTAELSIALYPFAGLGATLTERITLIGVRMATLKLALMCAHTQNGAVLDTDSIVRVIQSLARFMDHLGDPAFSLKIYSETGWIRESRLRGLLSI